MYLALLLALLMLSFSAKAQATNPPTLLFTDIVTGANLGGEAGNGVYVTLFGKNFGSSQGSSTVSLNGAPVASVKTWCQACSKNTMLDMIVVQLGLSNTSGNFVVTVGGLPSNGSSFTVSAGNIYFVATSGNDTNPGNFASPWKTPVHAKTLMRAGDTTYFRAGTYLTEDDYGSILVCNDGACSGTATQYQNFIGYPGETATFGSSAFVRGIYHWGTSVWQYSTVSNLVLRGLDYGITAQNAMSGAAANFIRVINNDMRALEGGSAALDFEMPAQTILIYGNESAQNCLGNATCNYDSRSYSAYFGGYGIQSNIDIGWNRFHDNPFGKGIQIYGHIANDKINGLLIHGNQIYNNTMTGMALGGSDGGTGFINDAQVYNNLIYYNETGALADHGIFGGLELNGLNAQDGMYQVYNNTFFGNAPAHSGIPAGGEVAFATAGVKSVVFENNIFYAAPGAAPNGFSRCYFYFDDQSPASTSRVTFSNNLYFNAGAGPTGCNYNAGSFAVSADASKVNADPLFVAPTSQNFHLQQTSPAVGAGNAALTSLSDFDQLFRPSPPSIGAYEFSAGTGQPPPPPPPPTVTKVVPSCGTPITTGQTSQCNAAVNGTNNPPQTATWAATGGNISSTGVFTPTATGTATITATSTFGSVSGSTSIVVTVVAPPPPPALVITCAYAKASKTTTCKIKGTVTGTLSVNASEAGGNVSSSMTIQ